jgi:alpha-glucosidase (family GH31 glycosyl hydrolase)
MKTIRTAYRRLAGIRSALAAAFLICPLPASSADSSVASMPAVGRPAPTRRVTSRPAGLPPLPPRWAFGHIKSKDEFKGRQDILSDVAWMEQNDVPCQVIHVDAPWAVGHNLFEFTRAKVLHSTLHPETVGMVYDFGAPGESLYLADPDDPLCRSTTPAPHVGQSLIDTLHAKGIRITAWITNRMNNGTAFGIGRFEDQSEREAPAFAFAERNGFLRDDMRTWHRGAGKTVNYGNPEAVAWWHRMMDKVLDMGVDGFVLDFGANVEYVRDTFGYLRAKKGDQAIMMSRSAPEVADATILVWAVDTKNDFSDKGIKYALEQVLTSSENGTPFVSGTQSPHGAGPTESFVCREVEFNAFCPVQFTFCYGDLSNPWDHGETATRVFKYYTRLHNELLPYIYGAALRAHRTGEAIIKRAPGDLEYTFGDDMLVAPIYRDETTRRVTFPAGDWIDYWNDRELYHGVREIDYPASLDRIPLFLRAGAIIPMDVSKNWTGHGTEKSAGVLTVLAYPSGESQREYLEPSSRTVFRCAKRGGYRGTGTTSLRIDGPSRGYMLRVKSFVKPSEVRDSSARLLPRRAAESQLGGAGASWCFDAAAGLTIIRLPPVAAESLELSFAGT